MSGAESPADPAWDVGCEVWRLRTQGGELIPLSNQLSGAVGGRASSALISIVKASLRAVFRGGSFVDGCGTAAQPVPRRCLRLSAASGLLSLRRQELVSSHTKSLRSVARREALAPRRGGSMHNDAVLEMPFGAQR